MPALAKGLAASGIASIRFDFNAHGKSEGRMEDMTIEKEIADAKSGDTLHLVLQAQDNGDAVLTYYLKTVITVE